MTDTSSTTNGQTVDFWFDPLCPWAWMSSRWLLEAARVRDLDVRFHIMSLAVLNEDKDIPEEYAAMLAGAMGPVRVCTAAAGRHGEAVLADLYTAIGTRVHPGGRELDRAVVAEALAEAGLDADLIDAYESTDHDDAVRASHQDGIGRVGMDVGTPVIAVGDVAFFGPVVTPAPKGEAAGRLWDGVLLVASTPGFYELKRTRDQDPIFD